MPPASDDDRKQLRIERVLPGRREAVYRAFTDPDQLARWFGPHGFVATTIELDVRPRGKWRAGLLGPDAKERVASGIYQEAVANERLVFTYAWEEHGRHGFETVCRDDHEHAPAITSYL